MYLLIARFEAHGGLTLDELFPHPLTVKRFGLGRKTL